MSTVSALRPALRVSAVVVPVASVALASPAAFAGTPATWQNPPPMSVLHALLLFIGVPVALICGITLLVIAPSLVRGDRQQRGVASWTEPQWFGAPTRVGHGPRGHAEVEAGDARTRRHEVGTAPAAEAPAGEASSSQAPVSEYPARESEHAGGASGRW